MGSIPTNDSANNVNILYNFDLSAETFNGVSTVGLDYSTPSIPTTIIFAPLTDKTISGVVNALNAFGLDLFYYSGTNIAVNSNTNIYYKIRIII